MLNREPSFKLFYRSPQQIKPTYYHNTHNPHSTLTSDVEIGTCANCSPGTEEGFTIASMIGLISNIRKRVCSYQKKDSVKTSLQSLFRKM